jgi:hypothetical protein
MVTLAVTAWFVAANTGAIKPDQKTENSNQTLTHCLTELFITGFLVILKIWNFTMASSLTSY